MNKIHRFLSRFRTLRPVLIFLAYVKSDFLKQSFEGRLAGKMVKGWRKMRILDVGSGPCFKERNSRFDNVDITCLDIYKPYLQVCKKFGFKTIEVDINKIQKYVSSKSYDIVWLLDVIEHLGKKEGLILLEKLDKIAKRQIIVWTPLGWFPQDAEGDGNRFQEHKSAWYKEDFEKRGYKCQILPRYHKNKNDAIWAIKEK